MLVEQINRWKVLLNIIDWIREKWKTMKKTYCSEQMYLLFFELTGGFPLLWLVYQSLHIKLQTTSAKIHGIFGRNPSPKADDQL